MYLKRLEVRNLRNLTSVSLFPSPALNIIEGKNASGKTSLLESIHLLALARSFRTPKSEQLIQHGEDSFTLFAEIQDQESHRLGLQRFNDNRHIIRIDGNNVDSRAKLASLLPIQVITPDSISLLIGGPSERRRYLDWLMFHVEPNFHSHWHLYQRSHKQRNALLRQGNAKTLSIWDEGVIENGDQIDRLRKGVIQRLLPHIRHYAALLLPDCDFQLSYRQGWKNDLTLSESIHRSVDTDLKLKYTTNGPHRADLVFKDGGDKVSEVFSRGQLKLLLCALKLAQMALLRDEQNITPLVLIDDLPAELDSHHRNQLLTLLHELSTQVFVTTTARELLEFSAWSDVRLFHVEHGDIKEVV